MNNYKIVLLSGDGIGPEISNVSKRLLSKLSEKINFKKFDQSFIEKAK